MSYPAEEIKASLRKLYDIITDQEYKKRNAEWNESIKRTLDRIDQRDKEQVKKLHDMKIESQKNLENLQKLLNDYKERKNNLYKIFGDKSFTDVDRDMHLYNKDEFLLLKFIGLINVVLISFMTLITLMC